MGLRDRLTKRPEPTTGSFSAATPTRSMMPLPGASADAYHELKHELHQKLIEKLDLRTIEKLPREQLRDELRLILNLLLGTELPLNRAEREQMVEELLDEVTGLGPLEPLLRDQTISDILVNTFNTVYIERFGKLELTKVRFRDNEHLTQIINRIVSRVGRRIDESSPMADARLPTARASTPSSRRWPSTARCSPFAASAASRCGSRTCSPSAASRPRWSGSWARA